MKPLGKIKIKWSPSFAYAVGLIVTDGSLSKDGRHIAFTSKDLELIEYFKEALGSSHRIGKKSSGTNKNKHYYVVQIGDVTLYRFLQSIGIMPNKSKIIGAVEIPKKYFFDFLRGHFDGDGSFYSYWDPRWKSSFMFYLTFVSASKKHINWIRGMVGSMAKVRGYITKSKNDSVYQLRYAKVESMRLLKKIYYSDTLPCLSRKRTKIEKAIAINKK